MFSSRRTGVIRRAAHAVIESLENRQLLSAGDLDTSFGVGGKVLNLPTIDATGTINDTAIQSDNRIVASIGLDNAQSAFAVRRYFNNGTVDTSFGTNGTARINLQSDQFDTPAQSDAIAMQSDGKILIAGRWNDQFAMARLTSAGKLDTTFGGGDGIATTDFGNGASGGIRDIVVQSDGKIVAVGSSNGVIALARYTTSGNLDTSFDGDGKILTNLTGNGERMDAVALQSDGKIITAGKASPSGTKLAVSRYNTNGSLDTSFDGDGTRVTSLAGELENVVVQSNGQIVATSGEQVIRLNSNGSTDNNFGSSGVFTVPTFSGGSDWLEGLGVRSDGKIVLGGTQNYYVGAYSQGVLMRLNSNGTLDGTFGTSGTKLFDIYKPTTVDSFQLLSDGRILVGGSADFTLPYLARFTSASNVGFETTFGVGGKATVDLITSQFTSAKVQSDGKVVAIGYAEGLASGSQDIYLKRFNTDGSADTSFGNNGVILIDNVGGRDFGFDLALAPGGKIVIVGSVSTDPVHTTDPDDTAYLIARFNSDGTPDSTFGTNGRVIRDDLPSDQEQSGNVSVAVQSDGKIIVGEFNSTIRRLNANGTLDTTFGTNGVVSVLPNTTQWGILNLRVLGDDSILFIGGYLGAALGKLTPHGTLDSNFGSGGYVQLGGYNLDAFETAPNGSIYLLADNGNGRINRYLFRLTNTGAVLSSRSLPRGHAIAVDADSDIIVVDTYQDMVHTAINYSDILLYRYKSDLTPDTSFGNNGTVQTDIVFQDYAAGAVIAPSGRIVAYGYAQRNDPYTTALLVAYQGGTGNTPPPPQTGTLSGFTFNDTNTNGQFDSGEQKTGGKTVFLDTNGNGMLDASERSTVTDSNGNYTFSNLDAGTYHVRRVFPAGFGYSTAPIDVTLAAGQNLGNLAIGSEPVSSPPPQTGSLVGFTFDDKNVDGQYETGEVKTGGKTVFLDSNGNNALDAGERSTVTDSSGNYSFTNLPAGTYHVRRVFPDGWTYSTAAIDVTLAAGQTITNLAIGSKAGPTNPPPTQTSISGFTFDDTDADGVYDSNEPKSSGKTVFLDTNNNGQLDSGERSVVTDSSGSFTFNNLSAGTYHVRRVFPSGWTYSTAPIDIDLSDGESVAAVAIGSKPVTEQTGIIRGFTFNDTNENGKYDAGEQKTGDKKVFLDINNNGFADLADLQTYSAADGSFSFTGLQPGTYHVRREFPHGYTYSTPLIDVNLQPGEIFTDALIGSKPTA